MSKSLQAWLLEWPTQPLALAQCEVIEVMDAPEIHRVPIGPRWCRALVYWRERLLPLALASDAALDDLAIVVVGWQTAPRTPLEFAALPVRGVPQRIDVPGDADCEPPAPCPFSLEQLRACFRYGERTIAVPELASWFAPPRAPA